MKINLLNRVFYVGDCFNENKVFIKQENGDVTLLQKENVSWYTEKSLSTSKQMFGTVLNYAVQNSEFLVFG